MSTVSKVTRFVKPAKCECEMMVQPIAPCEILDGKGAPGFLRINGTMYTVEILGYLPEVGEPVVDGFRLTKSNGEAHDLCLVAGRLECTCGDYEFRRAALQNPDVCDCKHCLAVKQLLWLPRDQYEPAVMTAEEIGQSVLDDAAKEKHRCLDCGRWSDSEFCYECPI